ncbi:hypothetical protein [Falsiphaeobacter marinintestinus]|uniref:hypothetical protein n=1 Tax=Falsiphaeobacter marinintestinus TaxID=1492905 RepID=UPI0016447954|nr:hypothetical protein [Phaeobacter marinintestinus]
MIRTLLHRSATSFENRYDYDAGYMHHVIDTSTNAGLRLAAFQMLSQYRGPKHGQAVWAGTLFGSTLDGDCGPCAQLVVDMAVQAGANPEKLRLCAIGQAEQAGSLGLGFRFAQAAILDAPEADDLRAQIDQKFGPQTVIAAAFAAASGRMYPVLKRSLGMGKACQRLQFAGIDTPLQTRAT